MSENEENEEAERLTYIGRRLQGGKLKHSFRQEDGSIVFYPKAPASTFAGARIGRTYNVGPRFPSIWASVEVDRLPDAECVRWQAADRAAYETKAERAGSSLPELDAAITALREARAVLPHGQRRGFDVWLLKKIVG